MFRFRFTWLVLLLFLAIFCCYFYEAAFCHEHSGIAVTGTSEVHVVQTNAITGYSQEMLPTCSKINPMELVLYSSRVSIGELITASGDPSLEGQPFSQLWPSLHPITTLIPKPNQPAAGMCQHSRECCLSRFNTELESDSPAGAWAAMCSLKPDACVYFLAEFSLSGTFLSNGVALRSSSHWGKWFWCCQTCSFKLLVWRNTLEQKVPKTSYKKRIFGKLLAR